MQALRPPPAINLAGLIIGVPASLGGDDVVVHMVERCRSNLLSVGIDPDGEGAPLLRIALPCGCHTTYVEAEDIPRQNRRCHCGMNWFIQYVPVGEDAHE